MRASRKLPLPQSDVSLCTHTGPAYGKMAKGDTIKQVDGQKAKSDNIATLLYGSGSCTLHIRVSLITLRIFKLTPCTTCM